MSAVMLVLAVMLGAGQQPAPKPFPQPGSPPRTPEAPSRPATPAPAPPPAAGTAPQPEARPSDGQLGVPVYPGAQFLASYPAGRGQRFFLFGAAASFVDVVGFYRSVLKQKGELIFDAPATHEFDIGRFREETMAFPPGVTVKDFQSQLSQGFPNPRLGAQPSHFPTVIQIVPVPSER
jgi:hypothetical protein